MPDTEQPAAPKHTRKLWVVAVVVVGLLALTTWDVVWRSGGGGGSAAQLRRAAFDGDEATVRRLITAHPEWIDSAGSTNGLTPMLGGLYDKTMKMLGRSPPSSSHGDPEKQFQELEGLGATPLFHAVVRKHVGSAMILLEARASPQAKLSYGWPVVSAAVAAGDTNLMAEMERRGAKLDELDKHSGMTLLHYAVYGQRPEMLSFLIAHGLSVNTTNRIGMTPLHLAVAIRKLPMVEFLATNGTDLTITSARGDTAFDLALKNATDSSGIPILTWLEAFTATNPSPAKPAP